MTQISIRHRVGDYNKWRETFDSFSPQRKAGGEVSYSVGHLPKDPLNLHLLFEWESIEKAENFLSSSELKAAMQNATVLEEPEVTISEKLFGGNA